MKTAKRVLALVVTVLLLVGCMSVAASAAYDLQAAINSAAAGDTVTMPEDVTASVVIDKDLILDLGGHELTGAEGKIAITVKNADVTVRNGHVYSKFDNVRSAELAATVVNESPAAIRVIGGSLTAEGLRVVGSFARIPTTTKYHLPTGSAIEAINGAEVTVIQSSLVGRYGVNNKVNNSTPGGKVKIEDGILMAFMRGVKDMSKLELGDGTEDVNAADRLEGFLNSGIKLEARERNLMKTVFADRLHIYTKSVDDAPEVELVSCDGSAIATAKVDDSRVWENNTSTDASYKYVPEYVVAGGKLIAMTVADDGTYKAELTAEQAEADLQIKYRLEFVLQSDVQGVLNNFDQYLELLYAKAVKTVNEVYDYVLEKYNKYMDALYEVDEMLMTMDEDVYSLIGKHTYEIPEYTNLTAKLFALGGAVMVNRGEFTGEKLPRATVYGYTNVFPTSDPADGVYGVLDRVAKLKNELDAYMPLKANDQSKWPEMVKWAYDNYEEVLALLDDGEAAIADVKDALNTGRIPQIMTLAPKAQQQAAKLDTALAYIDTLQSARDMVLASHTVQTVLTKLANNENEIIPYTQKFINIYNNHSTYFTPDKFLLENGTVGKAYAVYGYPEIVDGDFEHEWEETDRIPATVEEDGKIIYTCAICGETKEEIIPKLSQDVLWAGYEDDVVEEKLLDTFAPNTIYVVARKGEVEDTPMKIQIRNGNNNTMTYTRDHSAVVDIIPIEEYNGVECELWCIDRGVGLPDGTFTAVAKYSNVRGFIDITNEEGASFTVETPEPEIDNTVYSAEVLEADEKGVVKFDGVTKQTIVIVTGKDVTKVQLRNDDDNGTMTYNEHNAEVAESTLDDGTPVLVWTVKRLFSRNIYNFSIYTRSAPGLLDSEVDLQFAVKLLDESTEENKVLEASAAVGADKTVVFTVKTTPNAKKVRFTNTDDNGTMTFTRDNPKASVASSDNGETLTWTITIKHVSGVAHYNVQSLAKTYSDAFQLTVEVPAK